MLKMFNMSILIVLALMTTGCGTLYNLGATLTLEADDEKAIYKGETWRIYGGVRIDTEVLGEVLEGDESQKEKVQVFEYIFFIPLFGIDIILSAAFDTVTLPVVIPVALSKDSPTIIEPGEDVPVE